MTAGLPAAAAESLATALRQAADRAAGLSGAERRRALKLYLAHQLRGVPGARRAELLGATLDRFSSRPCSGPPAAAAGDVVSDGGAAERELEHLVARIRSLAGVDSDPALGPDELLEQLRSRAEGVDGAVKATAQEFFDRLLQALDPDAARAFVGKPGLRPAPIYKAAVFDAYAEKFSQLAEYHERGRLVRDFRASFKRNLRT